MDNLLQIIMLALLGGCGIYAIYTVIKLKKLGYLFPNRFMYPANCKPEDCTDVPGFIDYITPRLLILGIACLLLAGFLGVCWYTALLPLPVWVNSLALPLVGVAVFGWYIAIQNKVYKRFW